MKMKAHIVIGAGFVIMAMLTTLPVMAAGQQESKTTGTSAGILTAQGAYPIVTQPVSMSIAVGCAADGTPPEEKWFWKYMENLTGISMDVQQLTPQNSQEQMNLMFATGELPDMMLHVGISNAQVSRYGGQGFFLALEDLIEANAPNLRRTFAEIPLAKASVTSPDGHVYMLPGIFIDKESFATNRPWINAWWLENLGLEVPKTLDDFYKVLSAFKQQDANLNGNPNDEIPFGGAWDKGMNERLPILTALGLSTNGNWMGYRNNEPTYIPYDPLFKEYLSFMNRLWKEGLMDQDMFTQTDPQGRAKYTEGTVGFDIDGAPFVFTETHWLEYDAFTPLTSNWNDTPMWPEFSPITLSRFFVSQACDLPEAAIRWADWFFTTENSITFWGGPLAGSKEAEMGGMTEYGRYFDETNRIQFRLPPDTDSSWQYVYRKASPVNGYNLGYVYGKGGNEKSWFFEQKYGKNALPLPPSTFSTYMAEEPNLGILSSLSPGDAARFRSLYNRSETSYELKEGVSQEDGKWAYDVLEKAGWIENGTFLEKDQYWRSRFLKNVTPRFAAWYPDVFFTPEEVERLDELTTPLSDYVEQMEARFITGVEPLSNFDKYLNELEQLGVEEYLAIHVAAERRFKAAAGK